MRSLIRTCLLSGLIAALPFAAFAQETRGNIFGHVTDPNGGVIVGAKVVVTNVDTNVATNIETNESGYYIAELLVAGNYQVEAQAPGFKPSVQKNLVLQMSARLQVDMPLQIGNVSETVTVSAGVELVNTDTLSSGGVTEGISAQELPNPGNNTLVLAKFIAGMQSDQSIADWSVRLHSTGASSNFAVFGKVGGNEYSVDGVPNNGATRGPGYMPASELVQEMRVETSGFDAAYGHASGATVMVMTKAGTNKLHGNYKDSYQNYKWNALDFFTRQAFNTRIDNALAQGNTTLADQLRSQGGHNPGQTQNYAATIGGPVYVPKVFNGKNKLFFFFGFAGFQVHYYTTAYDATPTAAMRQGDFSQLLKLPNSTTYQIYDPYSTTPDATRSGHVIRTPFPNNIVPESRITNPVYKQYTSLLQLPNNLQPSGDPTQDFIAYANPYSEAYTSYANRYDYNASDIDRFFFRWSWNYWLMRQANEYATALPSGLNLLDCGSIRRNISLGLDWVHTFGPRFLVDVTVGSNQWYVGNQDPGFQSLNPSQMGFPSYMDTLASTNMQMPTMSWQGWSNFTLPAYPITNQNNRTLTGKADFTYLASKHTLKYGVDVRGQYLTQNAPGNNAGTFNFDNTWLKETDDGYQSLGTGNFISWAAFMMGLPTTVSIDNNANVAMSNPFYAGYIQDAWRVSPRMTINLGLRFEHEAGPTERYNRLVAGFNPNLVLPITAEAQAAYAANTYTNGVPASQFVVLGGNTYPGVNGLSQKEWSDANDWMPRVSMAYQLDSKSVLRFGAGIYYDTLNVLNESYNQTGFSNTTTTAISNDFGQTWLVGNPAAGTSPMTDPFPTLGNGARELTAIGTSLGGMTTVGKGYTFIPYDRPHARQNRWRLDYQRQLDSATAITIGYAGSYSNHLPLNESLSPVPSQYWAYGETRNNTVANMWNANVTNPFYIGNLPDIQTSNPALYTYMSNNSFFTSKTVQQSKLWSAYPQMNGLTETTDKGKAKTEEMDISIMRRFSKGFNVNVAYTRMWAYAADYFPNTFDTSPAFEPAASSNAGRPHRLVSTAVFQLPMGKGRKYFRQGPLSWFLGGYQLSIIQEYQPGAMINWNTNANLYFTGTNLSQICSGPQTLGEWFNTSLFVTTASMLPNTGQARTLPNYINGYGACRAMSMKNFNGSLARDFHLVERALFQFRVDAYNLGNHMQFSAPNVNPTSTQFGMVTSQPGSPNVNTMRAFVFTGRISF